MKKISMLFSAAILSSTVVIADEEISPADVISNALPSICTSNFAADQNTELSATCQTHLGLVGIPGGGSGNNAGSAGVSTGILNSTIYSDRNTKSIKERKEELQKKAASSDILANERFGFFASGKMTETERENTTLETGYEADTHGFTVGMDYFFSDQFVAGIAIDYADTDLDYNNNAGDSDYESISVITYGSFEAGNGVSVDGYLGWTGVDYDIQRNISMASIATGTLNTVANADTEANKVLTGLNVAYNMNFNAIEFTPSLRLDYSGTYLDGYTESAGNGLALRYDDQDIQSFKSNLGFNSSYSISMPWGVLVPQIHGGYIHEFLNHRRTIHASFVQDITNTDLQFKTDKPDRDYFVFGGGISSVLTHGVQLFVDYERTEGHRYLNSFTVSGGVRVAF